MALCQTEEMQDALHNALEFLYGLPSPPMDLIQEIESALRIEY